MEVITDFPERLKPGAWVYIGDDHIPLYICSCRWHGKVLLLAFDTIEDRDQAGELRNQLVYVHVNNLAPLPEGEYYHHQMIGLRVISDEGDFLGYLTQILETGANDVFVVRSSQGRELLLPAIESVIMGIDLQAREMHIHLLPGLMIE